MDFKANHLLLLMLNRPFQNGQFFLQDFVKRKGVSDLGKKAQKAIFIRCLQWNLSYYAQVLIALPVGTGTVE